MSQAKIPFNSPFIVGKEFYYIAKAVLENGCLSGNGVFTKRCHAWLEQMLGCQKVLLTHSCTAALEMAAILAEIGPGDEVIMPSYTFVSTANAFVLRGAVPVFVDIRKDTLNIDERLVEAAITEKTRAIVAVHYAGNPCEMETLLGIARRHGLVLIEDAAQALLSRYKDRPLGAIGDFGCFSFHETKNVISGEGGALAINTPDAIERAEIIWEKGTDRSRFFRGEVDKYTWVDIGSSFLPGELMAAFLYAQLEHAHMIMRRRIEASALYRTRLLPLQLAGHLLLPPLQEPAESNGHIFFLLTKNRATRDSLLDFLRRQKINALFHYIPLHSSPAGQRFGRRHGSLAVTDLVADTLIRLPLFYEITDEQIETVCRALHEFFSSAAVS